MTPNGERDLLARFNEGVGSRPTMRLLRRRVLLMLAQADGQPWTDDQAASGWTDHMAEVMYGKQAEAVQTMLDRMRTVAHEAGWAAAVGFLENATLANAWDEGHDHGVADGQFPNRQRPIVNPYRAS